VNASPGSRLALALRLGSARRIVAAMQVVLHLVRNVERIEMSLWEPTPPPAGSPRLPGPDATLFIGATLRLAPDDTETRNQFEHELREVIEQSYAAQRIPPVEYDLQIL
jgi:hypothetical protein